MAAGHISAHNRTASLKRALSCGSGRSRFLFVFHLYVGPGLTLSDSPGVPTSAPLL